MCELFGVNTSSEIQLNTLLETFFSHGLNHPHGWGMAFFGKNATHIYKEPVTANKSLRLREYLSKPLISGKMVARIRLATKGNMEYENCHPFVMKDNTGRTWTLAHNGTIFECGVLEPFFYVQKGQTDSERILCYIISQINKMQKEKGRPLQAEERFLMADGIICETAKGNKLNLMIYDGEYFYVHTNYKNSLYMCERGNGYVFSTVPLDTREWRPLTMDTLLVYKDGKLVFKGTNHGYDYKEDATKMKLLFLDYSVL